MKISFLFRGFLLLASFAPALRAQIITSVPGGADTVRIMQYNLLNYGNAANRPSIKNPRLATIVAHAQPDVLGVNEVFSQPALLDSILLALGPGWAHSAFSNLGGETQTNALFYRTSVFELRGQQVVSHALRDIIAYRLRLKDGLTTPHDTVFLTLIVAHLKAADGSADVAERAAETATIAAFLDSLGPANALVMGDMNVYTSTEPGYQNLVANPVKAARVYDPIARPGAWSGNAAFADVHTQSPRTTYSQGDGGVIGGLDDRFDQILVSAEVMGDSAGAKYLPGSYATIGQDGLHYNASLLDAPVDAVAPTSVVQALYEMSDHLPVRADFVLHAAPVPASIRSAVAAAPEVRVVNPIADGWLDVRLGKDVGVARMELVGMDGHAAWRWAGTAPGGRVREWIGSDVPRGVYVLMVEGADGRAVQRVMIP